MKFIVKLRLATPAFPGTAQLAIGAARKPPSYSENIKGTVNIPNQVFVSAAQHTRCHPHFAEAGLSSERLNAFVNVERRTGSLRSATLGIGFGFPTQKSRQVGQGVPVIPTFERLGQKGF